MWPVQYWCLKEPNRRLLSTNLSLAPQPLNAQDIETTLPPEVHPHMLALRDSHIYSAVLLAMNMYVSSTCHAARLLFYQLLTETSRYHS